MTKPNQSKSSKKASRKQQQQKEQPTKSSSNLKDSLAKMKNKRQAETATTKKSNQQKKQSTKTSAPPQADAPSRPESKILTPDFHYKIKLFIGNKRDLKQVSKPVLKMILTMSKIPAQYIKVKVEDDRFSVDTREFTRKFLLEQEYPEGVKVQSEENPIVKYDGHELTVILLLQTPVPKEVEEKHFAIAKSKHESYNIKLGDAVQPKKKLMQNMDEEHKKATKKRKRKQMEKDFEQQQEEKQNRKRQKRQEKRIKKKAVGDALQPRTQDQ
uniref:Uncharacterized protein n=1 Tax=Percolomonas cosmopolitus TaxID=63605 RepID=A0A7S1KSE5_9EUKA